MSKIRFIIDSTFGVTPEYIKEHNILVNPLNIIVDEQSYLDGVEIGLHDVMDAVNAGKKVTTSQPAPGAYRKLYDQAFREGAEQIICLTISSVLSGTVQAAITGAIEHPRQNDIFVHDTLAVNIEAAMLLDKGIKAMEKGLSSLEIIEVIKKNKPNSGVLLNLVTLDNLLKSGRVSKVKAFIGNLLHVKPVVMYKDAKIYMLKKFRADTKVYEYFASYCMELKKSHPGKLRIRLSHVNALDRVIKLEEELKKKLPDTIIEMGMEITPLLALYIAYGGIGMGWIFEQE